MALRHLLFYGLSRSHFRALKCRFGLGELVQVHHVIPQQFRRHPCLSGLLHVHDGCNLMLMPNRRGKEVLNTARPVHDGGHAAYNEYVGVCLDRVLAEEPEPTAREERVAALIAQLRARVRRNAVPWR